jgi:hypothetical protein
MFTQVPKPNLVSDVAPGSLLLIPDSKEWAIGMQGDYVFILERRRAEHRDGTVADFGSAYQIQLNALNVSRACYPWVGDHEPASGNLILFLENGQTSSAIVLDQEIGQRLLVTFEISSGAECRRGSADGQGLVYRTWRIDLQCSDGLATVFSRAGNE